MTPYDYLIKSRIETAKLLLSNQSHYSIKEIAEMLGYTDQHYFSNFFKQRVGVSPSEYENISKSISRYLFRVSQAIMAEKKEVAWDLIRKALCVGVDAYYIVQECLVKCINATEKHNFVVSDITNEILYLLKPYFVSPARKISEKIIIGTIAGDYRDIGKNVFKVLLEGKGFEVFDLGINVSHMDFINSAEKVNAKIIACYLSQIENLIEVELMINEMKKTNHRSNYVVMIIGNEAAEEKKCRQMGAEIYSPDAISALNSLIRLIISSQVKCTDFRHKVHSI